jgi:CheY-like chemotaxis protein
MCHGSPFGATNLIARERPNVILLDVMMPALSGASLGGILRERLKNRRRRSARCVDRRAWVRLTPETRRNALGSRET